MNKLLKQLLKHVCNILKPYRVYVYWDDKEFIHSVWNIGDALEWTSLYPNECLVNCFSRQGRKIFERDGSMNIQSTAM